MLGIGAGSVLLAAALAAQALCTVRWRGGIRVRLVALMLVVVIAVWVIEATRLSPDGYISLTFALPLFVTMLAPLTATSLWWWDIVRELDRARRAEGRLAAAQERLRLAGDLHDLQGHHLQVIALQLELAEKMMGGIRMPPSNRCARLARASTKPVAARGTSPRGSAECPCPTNSRTPQICCARRPDRRPARGHGGRRARRRRARTRRPRVHDECAEHGGGVSASLSLAATTDRGC